MALVSSEFCLTLNKPDHICQFLLKFCQSGDKSPNLVTLMTTTTSHHWNTSLTEETSPAATAVRRTPPIHEFFYSLLCSQYHRSFFLFPSLSLTLSWYVSMYVQYTYLPTYLPCTYHVGSR